MLMVFREIIAVYYRALGMANTRCG